jgi:hypothetical protein
LAALDFCDDLELDNAKWFQALAVVEQLEVLPGCVDAATSVPRSEQVLVAELPSGGAATLR